MIDNLFDLKKRYYLVTGAGGLLGREHCKAISSANGIPVAIDLEIDCLSKLQKELLEKYQIEMPIHSCSVTSLTQLEKLKVKLNSTGIFISGIINNAAINPNVGNKGLESLGRLETYDINQWDLELDVSLKGSYLVVRTFSKDLLSHNHSGVIVNISSDLGIIAPDQRLYRKKGIADNKQSVKPITYSVTKAGLIGMSKYFSTYFNGRIRSNALCPGGVESGQDSDFLNKVKKLIPTGRLAKVDEYRGTIIYMLSDASSYMNGSIICVDGGRTAW